MPVGMGDTLLAFELVSAAPSAKRQAFLDEHSGKIYWHLEEYRTKCGMIPTKARNTSQYVMAEDRMQAGRAGAEAMNGAQRKGRAGAEFLSR
jgi:hypothetical protein